MNMKTNKYAFLGLCMTAASCAATFTGCEDFFEQDSNQLVYAEGGHLNQPTDTVYSMMGILQKMQAIADEGFGNEDHSVLIRYYQQLLP